MYIVSSMRAICLAHPTLFHFITVVTLGEKYKL
jgi:hypothetical protein